MFTTKARIAPLKSFSIPRLELHGLLMGSRMKITLLQELSFTIDDVILWSDSRTALCWIRSVNRNYSAFVSHRVGEILDATNVNQWKWIPGNLNVENDATRRFEIPFIPIFNH